MQGYIHFYCEKLYPWLKTGTGGLIDPLVSEDVKYTASWKFSTGFNCPNL